MEPRPHLIIEAGPDTGREIRITAPEGLRAGRSSRNDIVLQDVKTSRYHCRFFIKPGEGLCVSDLGSANQTMVNDHPVREVRLKVDDRVILGDTVFRVKDDASNTAAFAAPALGAASPAPAPVAAAPVDLGLQPNAVEATQGRRALRRGPLLVGLAVIVALAIAAALPRLLRHSTDDSQVQAPPPPPPPLTIAYEKVLANTNRIFRYAFQLTPDRKLVVNVDDTETTHLREEAILREDLVKDLIQFIEKSGIADIEDLYTGIHDGALNQWDLTITLGQRVIHSRVVNRAEPPEFQSVREKLENLAQLELHIWALQYPPEKLIEMAQKAYLDARKLYDEREVRHGNLATAIRQMKNADFFLQTIDPKPDFHGEALAGLASYTAELDRRYIDQNFLATQAMQTEDMPEAARQLRILCDLLGDRADPRYEEAWNKLLEVESRINVQKK